HQSDGPARGRTLAVSHGGVVARDGFRADSAIREDLGKAEPLDFGRSGTRLGLRGRFFHPNFRPVGVCLPVGYQDFVVVGGPLSLSPSRAQRLWSPNCLEYLPLGVV